MPSPIGEPGIIWSGGAGITKGYVNLPELTFNKYRRDPFMNDGWALTTSGIFFLLMFIAADRSCTTLVTWGEASFMIIFCASFDAAAANGAKTVP